MLERAGLLDADVEVVVCVRDLFVVRKMSPLLGSKGIAYKEPFLCLLLLLLLFRLAGSAVN